VRLQGLDIGGISYGFSEGCQLKVLNFHQKGWMFSMDIDFDGITYRNIEVGLTGRHNALNAAAVFGLCLSLGLDEKGIRTGLRSFEAL
jgi:UDP-N-acetylmuramate--alanine ligase